MGKCPRRIPNHPRRLPDCSDRSAIDNASDALINAEAAVLDLHSPDIAAVIKKLEILWGEEELWAHTQAVGHRQLVIGDLRRISFLAL